MYGVRATQGHGLQPLGQGEYLPLVLDRNLRKMRQNPNCGSTKENSLKSLCCRDKISFLIFLSLGFETATCIALEPQKIMDKTTKADREN